MVRRLLIRGMLAGFIAGLLAFGFARVFGEPHLERAITFENQMEAAKSHASGHRHADAVTAETVSRSVQAGIGLFTGIVVHATAIGGLFALVFAVANGRAATVGPRAMAAILGGAGFVSVYLVPTLKYPASPPAVGDPGTIGPRTALFFIMLGISVAATIGAAMLRRWLAQRQDGWTASLTTAATWLAVVTVAFLVLPAVNEVPDHFPADLLWQFRVAAVGIQVVLWAALGLLFGALAERAGKRLTRA